MSTPVTVHRLSADGGRRYFVRSVCETHILGIAYNDLDVVELLPRAGDRMSPVRPQQCAGRGCVMCSGEPDAGVGRSGPAGVQPVGGQSRGPAPFPGGRLVMDNSVGHKRLR
ncbi:hypothetical protein [Streptomyces sp. NBC_00154]|uniref:hypothetical protein n=1 Tax=Streptomyces sp. NBC_00154 TaxID=2975670 RepID=UPI0022531466|nr:hypothetical protein [Streptomyces sp. NBC_00154]MCX5315627.1 hypothetical protein [Streptomyces sp. NBC_00154]